VLSDEPALDAAVHPLAMITSAEIRAAAAIFRDARNIESALFSSVTLREPTKHELDRFEREHVALDRRVDIVAAVGPDTMGEAVVNLTTGQLESYVEIQGVRPAILMEEVVHAVFAVYEDERFVAAMAKRGIDDLGQVQMDPWPPGTFGHPFEAGRRLTKVIFYRRAFPEDNGYGHPIENVYAFVDLATREVVELVDLGVVPIPEGDHNYDAQHVGPLRDDLKRLEIHQPDGPSFSVEGNLVRWQRWQLRVSLHPIEGLVLHQIAYDDPLTGRVRPIVHRASLSEMVVPYGTADEMHYWKNAFDAGEWGMGRMVNSLMNGCDCLGEIFYFDVDMADEHGDAHTVEHAICMHEEDDGILWKHHDLHSGTNEVRRSRRLVVSSIYTVGNYEYGFYWYFYLDGTIQLDVKLTGIIQPMAVAPGTEHDLQSATMIAPGIAAPHHQHLFCVRLDMSVDGPENSVYEVDVVPAPRGPDNPYDNAFVTHVTPLTTEHEAQRMVDPSRSRTWRIANPSVTNALGQPVAYKLLPGATPTLLAGADSSVAKRARFATKNLWVTPLVDDERHAAGRYPSQSAGEDGLPAYTAGNRAIVNTDIVVWHTFGVTHIVRPEDWPVMPVEHTGFSLVPTGFFDRNPALDVPPSTTGAGDADHCH